MTNASYVTSLLNEARDLVDAAGELGDSVARLLLGSARTAGLDPAVHAPLTGAALALGASQITVYTAAGDAHPDDICFLADVSDAEDDARDLLAGAGTLADKVIAALDAALADAEDAADDEDEDSAADAAARIRMCETALCVLSEFERRLRHAIARLAAVPVILGEVYESVYGLLRRGGRMPLEGRWLTGEDRLPPRQYLRLIAARRGGSDGRIEGARAAFPGLARRRAGAMRGTGR